MRINVEHLKNNGFIVDIDRDRSQVDIYPENYNNAEKFKKVVSLAENDFISTREAEIFVDEMFSKIMNQSILNLCQ